MAQAVAVKRVISRIPLPRIVVSPGAFSARRPHLDTDPSSATSTDPIIGCDDFDMAEPFFKPHPHAGFCAVTYLYPFSEGTFINRDSLGHTMPISPGDLHWTIAGSGLMHEEIPQVAGVSSRGLQLFVNLPSDLKLTHPAFIHVNSAEVPTYKTSAGGTVRVLTGTSNGVTGAEVLPKGFTFLDVQLAAGDAFNHEVPSDYTSFVLPLSGEVKMGLEGSAELLGTDEAAVLSKEGSTIVATSAQGANFLLLTGAPAKVKPVWGGSFCMDSEDRLRDRMRAYAAGEMGHLEPSDVKWARH